MEEFTFNSNVAQGWCELGVNAPSFHRHLMRAHKSVYAEYRGKRLELLEDSATRLSKLDDKFKSDEFKSDLNLLSNFQSPLQSLPIAPTPYPCTRHTLTCGPI